jgi:hypothetical protein
MIAAVVAAVGAAGRYAMVLGDPLAVLAEDAVWEQMVLQPLQADVIVGELPLEIPDGVLLRGRIPC